MAGQALFWRLREIFCQSNESVRLLAEERQEARQVAGGQASFQGAQLHFKERAVFCFEAGVLLESNFE